MKTRLNVPLFLQPGYTEELNTKIVNQTGCFAFLRTDQLLLFPSATSAHDEFMIYSVCLYSLYHDLGRKFLKILLSDDMCPCATLNNELKKLRAHVNTIEKTIRPIFAHAVYESEKRIWFQRTISSYFLMGCAQAEPTGEWPDYINGLRDEHWRFIANRFIDDANNLFFFLDKWADEWNCCTTNGHD